MCKSVCVWMYVLCVFLGRLRGVVGGNKGVSYFSPY